MSSITIIVLEAGLESWGVTAFGPLDFTAPTTCLQNLYVVNGINDSYANDPDLGWSTKSECYPSGHLEFSTAINIKLRFGGYYSPAICPSGYTAACPEQDAIMNESQTGDVCCPSGYICATVGSLPAVSCYSSIATQTFATIVSSQDTTLIILPSYGPSSRNSAWASPIRVRRERTHLPLPRETNAPTNAINTGNTTAILTEQDSNRTGLSNGAKIAIGVSIPVVFIAVMIIALLLCLRRKSNHHDDINVPELDSESNRVSDFPAYISHNALAETDTGRGYPPAELDSSLSDMRKQPAKVSDTPVVEMDNAEQLQRLHGRSDEGYSTRSREMAAGLSLFPRTSQRGSGADAVSVTGPPMTPTDTAVSELVSYQAVAGDVEDEEDRWLREEKARVRERRERLKKMEELEEEERRLDRILRERKNGGERA